MSQRESKARVCLALGLDDSDMCANEGQKSSTSKYTANFLSYAEKELSSPVGRNRAVQFEASS